MLNKPLLVVLTGAGMSAESGIKTFRDANGLWENHRIDEVSTPEGFSKNPDLVHQFYNTRRAQAYHCSPNNGHLILAALEQHFQVVIITQNVDGLHEKAGSAHVIHLHGELSKACCINSSCSYVEDIGFAPLATSDTCPSGHAKRPYIVWFGESVPMIEEAENWVRKADFLAIIGTSLQVYPAAGLWRYAPQQCPIFYIDPKPAHVASTIHVIPETAGVGTIMLREKLLSLL